MKKLFLIVCMFLLMVSFGNAATQTLNFDDADGTYWNQGLYGEPVFGPGEAENYYYGFNLTGWRVYDKATVGAFSPWGGTSSYIYQGTNGVRSISRHTFDPQFISRSQDFYFEGAQLAATNGADSENNLIVELIGYYEGSQVWYDTVSFSGTPGVAEVKDYISPYSTVLVDSVRFHSWELYFSQFVLDDFKYSNVPVPSSIILLGFGLLGIAGFRKKRN